MSVVDEIYDALTDDEALAALPSRLAAEVGARSCTLQTFSPDNQILLMVQNGYWPKEMHEYYLSAEMHQFDYWRPAYEQSRNFNRVLGADRLVDPRGYERSTYYNEFFRRFGDDTGQFLAGVAPHRQGVFILALHRGLRGERFAEAEEQVAQPLLAHLRRLSEVRTRLVATAQEPGARDALDLLSQAVLVTDHVGRLRFANQRGEDLLRRGPLRLVDGRVRAHDPRSDTALSGFVTAASLGIGPRGGATALPLADSGTLRAVVAPWRHGGRTWAVILVDDPKARDSSLPAKLAGLYGLTLAEAQTVAALAEGLSPAEVAEARGVSVATVRAQIHHALRKADARAIADLVRLAASLPKLRPPAG